MACQPCGKTANGSSAEDGVRASTAGAALRSLCGPPRIIRCPPVSIASLTNTDRRTS
jgi:hypothetical protein